MRSVFARLGREGFAGGFVFLTGLTLWLIVRNYPRGQLSEFGPGFVPFVSSIGLVILGAVMIVRALRVTNDDRAPTIGRAVVVIPFAMALFAFALEGFGLVLTATAAVFITTFATREMKLAERAGVSLALAALVTVLFGYALSLSIPVWPWFLR